MTAGLVGVALACLFHAETATCDEYRPHQCLLRFGEETPERVITSDLENLASVGIGGVCVYGYGGISSLTAKKPYGSMAVIGRTNLIRKIRHTMREAGRLGMELSICIGPVGLGNERTTPENALKRLVGDPAKTGSFDWRPEMSGFGGSNIDPLRREAVDEHWRNCVQPLLDAVTPEEKKAWKGIYVDSWEGGRAEWTQNFEAEFLKRRGYAITPARFHDPQVQHDYELTIGELFAEVHYGYLREKAHAAGLLLEAEACGPHMHQGDIRAAQTRCDRYTGEFWMPSRHRPTLDKRFMLRDSATAAHVSGRAEVRAEAFTTMGTHWIETPATMKPCVDRAFCDGLTHVVWHGMLMSDDPEALPGDTRRAGAYYSPKVTWFSRSKPLNDYFTRCGRLLVQGRFAADCLIYAGDALGLFIGRKKPDEGLGAGYDYDYCPTEFLLKARVENREFVLPCGMRYKALRLSDRALRELPLLSSVTRAKLAELESAGVPILRTPADVASFRAKLPRDFEACGTTNEIDWIHRSIPSGGDIYFVANLDQTAARFDARLRLAASGGMSVELYDAVTDRRRNVPFANDGSRVTVPIQLPASGSVFIICGAPRPIRLTAPWKVQFDPQWAGPAEAVTFTNLISWTQHRDPRVRHYSGTATYSQIFDAPGCAGRALSIDLGRVRDVAEIYLNGESLGIAWTPPFSVSGGILKSAGNLLEVKIVNQWPNRLIGDAALPPEKRVTKLPTTPNPYRPGSPLLPSGLLGPVGLKAVTDR